MNKSRRNLDYSYFLKKCDCGNVPEYQEDFIYYWHGSQQKGTGIYCKTCQKGVPVMARSLSACISFWNQEYRHNSISAPPNWNIGRLYITAIGFGYKEVIIDGRPIVFYTTHTLTDSYAQVYDLMLYNIDTDEIIDCSMRKYSENYKQQSRILVNKHYVNMRISNQKLLNTFVAKLNQNEHNTKTR